MSDTTPIDALVASLCRPLGFSYCVQPIEPEERTPPGSYFEGQEYPASASIRSPKRRREFAAGRRAAEAALRAAPFFVDNGPVEIRRKASGAPASPCPGIYLSISHSGPFATAVAALCPVGIDIERDEPRPQSLVRYFFSINEQSFLHRLERRTLGSVSLLNQLWSRKEAAAKVGEWGGQLSFREMDCIGRTVRVEGRLISLASRASDGFVAAVAYDKDFLDG